MRNSIKYDTMRLAIIRAVKEKAPEGGFICKMCEAEPKYRHKNIKHRSLHRVDIRGIGVYYLCDQCIEELHDYFLRKELSAHDHMFGSQVVSNFMNGGVRNHIEQDVDDMGSYYSVAKYIQDHIN